MNAAPEKPPRKFPVFPVVITLFWLLMMGGLVYREVIRPHIQPAGVRIPSEPEDIWMSISMKGGGRIGFFHLQSAPEERAGEPGMATSAVVQLDMPVFGMRAEFFLTGSAWSSQKKGLSEFAFTLQSAGQRIRVQGSVHEGILKGELHTGEDAVTPFRIPVGDAPLFSEGLDLPAAQVEHLHPGKEMQVDTFDPVTLSVSTATIRCTGEESVENGGATLDTFVMETEMNGSVTRTWVTAENEVIRAELPLGLVLERMSPEEAMRPASTEETAGLVEGLAIRPKGLRPVEGAVSLRVRFSGIAETNLPPSSPIQTRGAGVYVITVPEDPHQIREDLSEADRDAALSPEAFAQSRHPEIQALAKSITAGADLPWERARRIYAWVYEHIEKTPVISVPSALEVLKARQGDCNEHTVLFTALARAAGIPTRIAIGLVWSETLGAFGYHAWPEVYIEGWVPMDPTLGEEIADATHIKLLNGSVEKWAGLLPFMGQLEIEVLSVEEPK